MSEERVLLFAGLKGSAARTLRRSVPGVCRDLYMAHVSKEVSTAKSVHTFAVVKLIVFRKLEIPEAGEFAVAVMALELVQCAFDLVRGGYVECQVAGRTPRSHRLDVLQATAGGRSRRLTRTVFKPTL